MRLIWSLAFVSVLPAHALGQGRIAVFEGSGTTDLNLRVFDEADPSRPGRVFLDRLQVLPIEMTNRTAQMSFVPGRTQRRTYGGLTTLDLPSGGRIYKYARRSGAVKFGYLLIQRSGEPKVLHELPGLGAGGSQDPYDDRIGIAPDGRHALLSSEATLAAWVVRLDGGDYRSTGVPSRPLQLPANSAVETLAIVVGPTHAFFVIEGDRILRCALADGQQPVDVTPPAPPGSLLKDQLGTSDSGHAVAFLLGPKDFYRIYLLRSTGPAVQLSMPASDYEEPGYLPEFVGGPRLLLNADASRILYFDGANRDEIFLADTGGATGTTQVTSDANFEPYIGVGIFPAFAAQTLALGVGDPGRVDWIAATTSSRTVINLTKTGGRQAPPYGAGGIDPNLAFLGGDNALYAVETVGATRQLRRVDPVGGQSDLVVPVMRGEPIPGSTLGPAPTTLFPGRAGDVIAGTQNPFTLLRGPAGVELTPEITASAGAYGLFTAAASTGGNRLIVVRLPGGALLPGPWVSQLRQIALTPGGGVLMLGSQLDYASPSQRTVVPIPGALRFLASGAMQ